MAEQDKVTIAGVAVHRPTGALEVAARTLAPRRATLHGARVGILDNHKEFAALVLRGVAEALKREHGVAEVKIWRKDYLGKPSPYAHEMVDACDVVINGVGH